MKIEIDDGVLGEFEYMLELFVEGGDCLGFQSSEELVNYVLRCVAEGSRRPGSWERQFIEMMGLVAPVGSHHSYRAAYGRKEGLS